MSADLAALLGRVVLGLLLQIALIVLLAWLATRAIGLVARRTIARLSRPGVSPSRRARLETVLHTAGGAADAVIVLLAGLIILYSLGINIAPVLAAVGVAGLAVSLGAQALIRDFIGGLLILIEDQYHVGDVIQVGTTSGKVEEISLRATRLRDDEGRLWIVPNGDVRVVSNFTRDWARAVVDVTVPEGSDPGQAVAALEEALRRMAADPIISADLLSAPEVRNWNSLTATGVQVRLLAKTAPGRQWAVARSMRSYAANALREVKADTRTSADDEGYGPESGAAPEGGAPGSSPPLPASGGAGSSNSTAAAGRE